MNWENFLCKTKKWSLGWVYQGENGLKKPKWRLEGGGTCTFIFFVKVRSATVLDEILHERCGTWDKWRDATSFRCYYLQASFFRVAALRAAPDFCFVTKMPFDLFGPTLARFSSFWAIFIALDSLWCRDDIFYKIVNLVNKWCDKGRVDL